MIDIITLTEMLLNNTNPMSLVYVKRLFRKKVQSNVGLPNAEKALQNVCCADVTKK